MSTILLIAQSGLFGFIVGLQFPLDTHPLQFFALIALNAVLTTAFGATNND